MRQGNFPTVRHMETALGFAPVRALTGTFPPSSLITSDVVNSSCILDEIFQISWNCKGKNSFLAKLFGKVSSCDLWQKHPLHRRPI